MATGIGVDLIPNGFASVSTNWLYKPMLVDSIFLSFSDKSDSSSTESYFPFDTLIK
ncbi:MAG: hypothetical protein GY928_34720 [Colwellia sp.]|nr:hypothetical protein [Colwellia sp.]